MISKLRRFGRRGISSVEMIVAMGSGAILMAGLSGILVLSSKSLDIAIEPPRNLAIAGSPLGILRQDLEQALQVDADNKILRLTVPDRDGDGVNETIAYRLGSENGSSSLFQGDRSIRPDTKQVSIRSTGSSSSFSSDGGADFTPASGVNVPNAEVVSKVTGYGNVLSIELPAYSQPGDVYLVGIAIATSQGNISQASGWNIVEEKKANNGGGGGGGAPECQAGLYSFITTSTGSSSHVFSWTQFCNAYCWVMRITEADSFAPITASSSNGGYYGSGNCPNATTLTVTKPYSTSIQFIVAEADALQKYRSGLPGYVDQVFGEANELDVTVSVRKHKNFTGGIDENTPMLLVAPSNWVNIGAVVCSPQ